MIKKLLTFLLITVGMASAQSHTLPTLDRNNAWTGNNSFIYGKLSLNQGANCTTGQYVTGYTNTFAPICSTPGSGSGVIVSINGDTTPAQIIQGSGGITCSTTSGTTTCNYAGGAGSGNVGMANAYQLGAYPAAGTTIDGAPHTYILNPSMSTANINTLLGTLTAGADTVLIPDGTLQQAWSNPTGIQMVDYRKGMSQVQLSTYGAVCDARLVEFGLTSGTNVQNGFSQFSASDVGKTLAIGLQQGYPLPDTQSTWLPTITAVNTGTGYITLSGNAPFNMGLQPTLEGTNNTAALQAALNNSSSLFPMSIPADCFMMTDTLQWNGGSIVGLSEGTSALVGVPGHDVLQQTDGPGGASSAVQMNTFSIYVNAQNSPNYPINYYSPTGTLTVEPALYRPLMELSQNSNNPLAIGWAQNAFNGVAITTQNTNVICYSTASGQKAPTVGRQIVFPYMPSVFTTTVTSLTGSGCTGVTAPATMAASFPNTSGYTVNQAEWVSTSSIQSTSTTISGTPTYPFTITLNNPIQPDPSAISNVASQGHIKIGSAEFDYMGVSGYNGSNIITIRNGPASVNSGSGYSGTSTVVPLNPCYARYDTPWPVTPSINVGTITAYAIVSNVITFTANNSLVAGQTVYITGFGTSTFLNNIALTVSSTGLSSTSFQASFTHANASATETGRFGNSTPYDATYFPGLCGGAAGISFPQANGNLWAGGGTADSNIHDIFMAPEPNLNSWQNQFFTMGVYMAGNNGGYDNTWSDITIQYLWAGFMQGPASTGQHGVALYGPTGTGSSFQNCTIRTAYPMSFIDLEEGKIDRCDTYTTLFSPYDGTVIGASTWLHLGYTLDEQTGNLVTNTANDTITTSNDEPENGSHIIIPPGVDSECGGCNFYSDVFEGVFNIFGSGNQTITGSFIGGPVLNYGNSNSFSSISGLNVGLVQNTWLINGGQNGGFINWGTNTNCSAEAGGQGPSLPCGAALTQPYSGQTADTLLIGQFAHPIVGPIGGMIVPGEWNTNATLDSTPMTTGYTADATEPMWGSYASCNVTTGSGCSVTHFDGFNGYIYIGPHNRFVDAPYELQMNLRMATTPLTTVMYIYALDPGTGTCSSPGQVTAADVNVTTSWASNYLPVNLTGKAGCVFQVVFGPTTAGSDSLRVGGFNMIPVPQWSLLPVATFSGACPVSGAILGSDATNMYVCVSGTVQNLPFGGGGGGGGGGSFSALTSGPNTTAAMTVGSGASLSFSGSGTIAATTSLAAGTPSGTPTLCSIGSAPTGVGANFAAQNCTPYMQGALTVNNIPVATAPGTLSNSLLTDNGTTLIYSGIGGVQIVSTLPGVVYVGAGTGSLGSLPGNSYGFVGPTSGGTPYLIQNPPTATTGFLEYAAPTTVYGVNVTQGTFVSVPWNFAANTFAPGIYSSGNVIGSEVTALAGHVHSLNGYYVQGTCTTPPIIQICDATSSTCSSTLTLNNTGQATTGSLGSTVPFAAGDLMQIKVATAGSGCSGGNHAVSAEMVSP